MKYKNLFEPGKIGNVTIPNRIVVTPMGTGLAHANGEVSQEYLDYVTERAKGGVGLFITEIVLVDEVYGQTLPHQLKATRPMHVSQWRRLADSVHKYGGKIFAQLHHPGRSTSSALNEGRGVVSSGDLAGKRWTEKPRMLTKEEIKDLVAKFANAAVLLKGASIDGVELHAAHTYLIHQFISELVNNRTDEYGGSFENRMRFVTEIIAAVRESCGPDYPISVRISAQEYYPGGYGIEEGVRIAKYLENLGVDAINVSNGISESTYTIQEPPTFEQGWKIGNTTEIKKAVNIPVIAVGAIRQPAYASKVLEEGRLDFVGTTRSNLADPYWSDKARAGKDEDIRPCIQCLYCFTEISKGRGIRCTVNPLAARERELSTLDYNGDGRVVAVVGGGPAGLEAAHILAKRGFKVTLFERSGKAGGALQLANKPLHKERIDWLIDNMVYQAKEAGAEIRLNTPATLDEIKKLDPYAVVVATGSKPIEIKINGCDAENVHSAIDYLEGKVSFSGKNIAVIGGGTTGCEIAEKLAIEGNDVTIVEMLSDIGLDMYPNIRMDFMMRLDDLKVNRLVNAKLEDITSGGIVCNDISCNQKSEHKFDAVILSLGFVSDNNITKEITENFENVRVIGDAVKVRKIVDAIFEGYSVGFTLK